MQEPPLTTVHIPKQEMGSTAVRLLVTSDEVVDSGYHLVLGTELVIRDSTCPPGGSSLIGLSAGVMRSKQQVPCSRGSMD